MLQLLKNQRKKVPYFSFIFPLIMKIKFSKIFKGNISFYERKKLLQKQELRIKGKLILRRKEKFMLRTFWIKKKVILRISGSKRRSFSTQEVGRKMIFP